MGKLKDLWGRLATCRPDEKAEIQKEINKIEKICIEKGWAGIKEITDWNKPSSKKTYRFESSRMGNYGIPFNANTGRDRCGACRWNNHTWCDGGKTKMCVANV